MKSLVIQTLLYITILLLCSQCVSKKYVSELSKISTYDVTYQNWILDDQNTSGFDLLIPIKYNPENVELDSVYFKNMTAKLTTWHHDEINYFIGRFYKNSKFNINNSIEASKYYAQLGEDECIVTYKHDSIKLYNKLKHVKDVSHLPFYLTRD